MCEKTVSWGSGAWGVAFPHPKNNFCPNNFYPSIKPKISTNAGSRGSCSSADGALEVPAKRDYRVLIMGASRVIKYNGSFAQLLFSLRF